MAELLVVGGGLAGAAMAAEVASAGREVMVLERSRAAEDKVCGDFLSVEALAYLERLGISVATLGAVAIDRVRLVGGRGLLVEAKLPFAAMSLSRRVLDEAVLEAAQRAGALVRRGATVVSLERSAEGWAATLEAGDRAGAKQVAVATGKQDLRGWARGTGGAVRHEGLVAFKMYWKLGAAQHAELGAAVELILFPGGYAGLQAVDEGRANLCLLIEASRVRGLGGWSGVLEHMRRSSPHLEGRLENAEALLARPLAVSSIPYGFVQRAAAEGVWRVGDQAAVIPSLAGDGMAIALHSGVRAGQAFARGVSAEVYQCELADEVRRGVGVAVVLSRLMVGWPGAISLVRSWPGLLPRLARSTRIPTTAWGDFAS